MLNRSGSLCRWCLGVCLLAAMIALWTTSTARAMTPVATQPASVNTNPNRETIFGTDDRRLVSNTTTFPWSAIGQVQVSYGYDVYVGTGAMIGRYLAVTCGHVAADPSLGTPTSIYFIPGQTSTAQPFGQIKVTQVIPSAQWQAYQDDGYDIAILVLDQPIGDQTGYFKIAVQPDAFFDSQPIEDAGYPTDKGGMDMYTVSGVSSGMQGNVMFHDLDTEPGQSGSPVWYGDAAKGEERLVGLNEGSYLTTTAVGVIERGIAARIDQSVANWIDEQLAAHNDISQNITAPVDPGTQIPSYSSFCGTGVTPFLMLSAIGWGGCVVSRRGRDPRRRP